jgi:hypothetical protein
MKNRFAGFGLTGGSLDGCPGAVTLRFPSKNPNPIPNPNSYFSFFLYVNAFLVGANSPNFLLTIISVIKTET